MNGMNDPHAQEAQEAQKPQGQPSQAPPNWTPPPVVGAAVDPRRKSPVLAMVLSLMPGLGQIYVGYYQRGFIHILVVASLIAFLAATGPVNPLVPLAGLFLAFFWLYNIVDAARRAMFYNHALSGGTELELPDDFRMPGPKGSIIGGICFLALGGILLSNTLFGVSMDWVEDWWPVALFIPGIWLIVKAIQEKR